MPNMRSKGLPRTGGREEPKRSFQAAGRSMREGGDSIFIREDSDGEEDADDDLLEDEQNIDLFYQHFNRDPLPQEHLQSFSSTSHKIKLDSATELHVVVDPSAEKDLLFNSNTSHDDLRRLAASSFDGTRKVLKTRWMKHSSTLMTERQASIYPFLTRYMDMLITTESRKVCWALTNFACRFTINALTLPTSA